MRNRSWILALLATVLGVVMGTTAQPARAADDGAASGPAWVIVSVGGENKIAVFSRNAESGELKPHDELKLPGAPGSLAVNAEGTRLYAAVRSGGEVATIDIDRKSGRLKLLESTKVEGNPVYVAVAPGGRHLLTAYYGDGKAAVYPLADDGRVIGKATSVVTTNKNPHCILPHPQHPFVYVPNTGADLILTYRWEPSTGKLSPTDKHEFNTEAGSGPRHAYFHPSKPWLYVVNEKDSSVSAFHVDGPTGWLAQVQKTSTLPKGFSGSNTCADIEITPDGKYLYASNRGHDSLAMYVIHPRTGQLISLGQVETEKTPREFAIDPNGRFVYSAGQGSGRLAAYRINPRSGELSRFATYDVGASPAWVLVLPQE